MKNIIVKNGMYALATLFILNMVSLALFGTGPDSYEFGEIFGYSSIILCLVFVFLGIRQNNLTNDKVSFMNNFGVGSAISFFPSLFFGIYNVVYVKWIEPDFMENYYEYTMQSMKATMSSEEFEIAKNQMMAEQDMFNNIYIQFFFMFLTVFVIGIIISILTSTIYQFKTARS